MKDKPSRPAPVIVQAGPSATQQATFNKDAALKQRALNMVDQYTPQGSVKYSPTGTSTEGIPGFQVTKSFSPEQQGLYDTSTALSQKYGDIGTAQLAQVQGALSTPFSTSSLGTAPTIDSNVRATTLTNMLARLQPQMNQDKAALETSLANQGFVTGTQGYNDAMDQYNRQVNDLYLGADIGAGSEMANQYNLQSTVRDKAINELLMQRNQPMNELSALMSGSQPTNPSFVPTPQGSVGAPDYMGAALASANSQNAANQNTYSQQMGSYNNNLSGLYGLGGAALGGWGRGGFKWGG